MGIFELLLDFKVGSLLVIAGLLIYLFFGDKKLNQPPGPPSLPLVGSIPFILPINPPYECFLRLKQKYGDVFSIKIPGEYGIVISTYDLVKEAFQVKGDIIIGRPHNYVRRMIGNRGLLWSDGTIWRDQRRFALSTLRDFGMGKVSVENKIIMEAENFMVELSNHTDKPVQLNTLLSITVSNVIGSVVFNHRYEYDDPVGGILNKCFTENSTTVPGLIGKFIPKKYRPFLKDPAEELVLKNKAIIEDIVADQIQKHKETLDENNIRDFTDAYLMRMKKEQQNGDKSISFNEIQMARTIMDLFFAGTETTSTTLRWGIFYMCTYPDIQKKVQAEIDTRIENGRIPNMADKQNLPYTEAVLLEIQRFAVLVPIVPHRATEDTTVGGYNVYKDTIVYAHLWSLLRDSKVWQKPDEFHPGHFLDENGKVVNREQLISFSIGRRQCTGESLAKMELFILFVALLQHFSFSFPKGEKINSVNDTTTGTIRMPNHYNVVLTERKF